LLWGLSEVLNAPQEKLVKTAKRLVREWKEARREKKRLLEQEARIIVSKKLTVGYDIKTTPIDGVKFARKEFEQVNVDRMIKIASELVKRNSEVVAIFYGVDKKTARIVVMAGKEAVNRGINSREIAGEVASVLGGGGSGRTDFAQGGGTLVKKMSEALAKAEEIVRKQLKKRATY